MKKKLHPSKRQKCSSQKSPDVAPSDLRCSNPLDDGVPPGKPVILPEGDRYSNPMQEWMRLLGDTPEEIARWLNKAIWEGGFRKIDKSHLHECPAEWDFSRLEPGNETAIACAYEYAREVEKAYEFQRARLRIREDVGDIAENCEFGSHPIYSKWKEGLAFEEKFPRRLRTVEIGGTAFWRCFPVPYLLLPKAARQWIAQDYCPPLVEEAVSNQREPDDFPGYFRGIMHGEPLPEPKEYRLRIHWGVKLIVDVKKALIKWFQEAHQTAWKRHRGRSTPNTLFQDGLAQLSAWRAVQAGLSCSQFVALQKKAKSPAAPVIRKYGTHGNKSADSTKVPDDGGSAFHRAAKRAKQKIAKKIQDACSR